MCNAKVILSRLMWTSYVFFMHWTYKATICRVIRCMPSVIPGSMVSTFFFFILRRMGKNKASRSSPHFHVFSYASCVDLTQLPYLLQRLACRYAPACSVFCVLCFEFWSSFSGQIVCLWFCFQLRGKLLENVQCRALERARKAAKRKQQKRTII